MNAGFLSFVSGFVPSFFSPKTLDRNHTETLEVLVITGGEVMTCYAAGHGKFPCSQSVVFDGEGAPPLKSTQRALQVQSVFLGSSLRATLFSNE